ncbi:MAG: DUF1326 domain-containing protein [Gammaproteobacteria bacterium]|nr:DUF1326 domain-containing protein [Gammaproteobacteria bacterium]
MDIPQWQITLGWIETCNCNYGCPCNFNGYPTDGYCQSLVGIPIKSGHYGAVVLDGVNVVFAASWPGAIHQGGGRARLYISEDASSAQRDAVVNIFSGQAGGSGPFALFAQTITHFDPPVFARVEVHVDGRRSRFEVPGACKAELEAFTNPVSGDEQDIQVHMPQGFIFRTALAARTKVMKLLGLGPLSFEHSGKNAFFAEVNYAGP